MKFSGVWILTKVQLVSASLLIKRNLSIVFLVRGLWDPQREGVLEVTGPGLSLQDLLGLSLQKPLHVKRRFGPMWEA